MILKKIPLIGENKEEEHPRLSSGNYASLPVQTISASSVPDNTMDDKRIESLLKTVSATIELGRSVETQLQQQSEAIQRMEDSFNSNSSHRKKKSFFNFKLPSLSAIFSRANKEEPVHDNPLYSDSNSSSSNPLHFEDSNSAPKLSRHSPTEQKQSATPKSKKEPEKHVEAADAMKELIKKQEASGKWSVEDVFSCIGAKSADAIRGGFPNSLGVQINGQLEEIWATALAVAYLITKFADKQIQWELVVEKAKKWISRQSKLANVQVDWYKEAELFISTGGK